MNEVQLTLLDLDGRRRLVGVVSGRPRPTLGPLARVQPLRRLLRVVRLDLRRLPDGHQVLALGRCGLQKIVTRLEEMLLLIVTSQDMQRQFEPCKILTFDNFQTI